MTQEHRGLLRRDNGPALAFKHVVGEPGAGKQVEGHSGDLTIVWINGFGSDLEGAKASLLAAKAMQDGRAFLRFDVRGCGASEGRFEEATIGAWLQDCLDVIDARTEGGDLLLVGSSLGGWLALLAAARLGARAKGLVLVAPAPDCTERLMRPGLPPEGAKAVAEDGVWFRPNPYGPPQPITRALLEEGRAHLILDAPILFDGPVRILHGQRDADVPWTLSLELAEKISSTDLRVVLTKSGDHRLSAPDDLALLAEIVDEAARAIQSIRARKKSGEAA